MTTTGTPTVRNHAEAVNFLTTRRSDLLATAEMQTEFAARLLSYGDQDGAAEMMQEAKTTLASISEIDACRVSA